MDTLLGLHGRFRIPFADELEMGCERGERADCGPLDCSLECLFPGVNRLYRSLSDMLSLNSTDVAKGFNFSRSVGSDFEYRLILHHDGALDELLVRLE